MLVLSRNTGERILIGDDIAITVVRIGPNSVRLGIDAPRGIKIIREELELVPPVVSLADPAHALQTTPEELLKPACTYVAVPIEGEA